MARFYRFTVSFTACSRLLVQRRVWPFAPPSFHEDFENIRCMVMKSGARLIDGKVRSSSFTGLRKRNIVSTRKLLPEGQSEWGLHVSPVPLPCACS